MAIIRSMLFLPGNNSRFIEKAPEIRVDALVLDLEDSVPYQEKETSRNLVKVSIPKLAGKEVFVRVNSSSSGLITHDLEAVVMQGLRGLIIPKSESPEEIRRVETWLGELEPKAGLSKGDTLLIPIVETAKGIVNAHHIAKGSGRVIALLFGAGDFSRDMGVEWTKEGLEYSYARSKVAVDARAGGVTSIDSVYMDLEDMEGFVRDTELGRRLGYKGRAIIHPRHAEATNRIFSPTVEEIVWSRRVAEAFSQASREGKGAISLDGKLVDIMHYRRALDVLKLIESMAESDRGK